MKSVVLIVEDEFCLRCDLADEFRDAGYVVMEAASADHALKLCHDEMPVDVLIADIRLNGSDRGWDVAKEFRALWGNIPVVYTSGNAFDARQSVSDSLFFAKPYHPAEIVAKCHQLMASKTR